jgi:hypothetical protein
MEQRVVLWPMILAMGIPKTTSKTPNTNVCHNILSQPDNANHNIGRDLSPEPRPRQVRVFLVRIIITTGQDGPAIRRERHIPHYFYMALQGVQAGTQGVFHRIAVLSTLPVRTVWSAQPPWYA